MFTKMKHMNVRIGSLFFILSACLISTQSFAGSQNLIDATITKDGELTLVFEDVAEVENACDLSFSQFEYLSRLNLINLKTADAPCILDRIGKRKGTFRWKMPAFPADGSFFVLLNDRDYFELVVGAAKVSVRTK